MCARCLPHVTGPQRAGSGDDVDVPAGLVSVHGEWIGAVYAVGAAIAQACYEVTESV
ncbi:hypothetical protein GCM10010276_23360 [Streptomyces longisporus]|uniref:Uncharacterized protein n=1 Tax=Streptomyces longisporus TaxID=1948 RepID=A0ABN3LIG6_STRLO